MYRAPTQLGTAGTTDACSTSFHPNNSLRYTQLPLQLTDERTEDREVTDWPTLPKWALLVALITRAYTFCQVQGDRAGPGLSCSSEQTSDVWKAPGSRLYRHSDVYPSPPRRSHCAAQTNIPRTHCPAHIQTRQQTNRTQGKPLALSHTLVLGSCLRGPPPQTVDNTTAASSSPEDDTRVPGRESPVWRILGVWPVQEQMRPSLRPTVFRGKASHPLLQPQVGALPSLRYWVTTLPTSELRT